MAVNVDQSEAFRLGKPELLFRRPPARFGPWPAGFAVTAGGQRFLTIVDVKNEESDPEILVVENWLTEFEHP